MSTYALVTKAAAGPVTDAVRAGRTGGYVVTDPLGVIVLFDPPSLTYSSTSRLAKPARALVRHTETPAWLLLCDEELAEAVLLDDDGESSLQWAAGWEPASEPARYLADRQEWDAYCAELATRYWRPEAGPALAMVRNDPVPGEQRIPLPDLLRRLCAVFDLPDIAVGRSLLDNDEPGLHDARRVEPAPHVRAWHRLFARA
ncbi:hypothetical protein ACFQS1_35915 [Paractinoplanes rhizophilus]|jgi:hypothetical protein|uniref:Uncharacterized protein n=1 Tax=Paractinoplanes rhizophilus TaxID=1416877 RepID=A0ABW2I3G2_9ACTN|nr:hypothetical protein [Actinoplanes sp.]